MTVVIDQQGLLQHPEMFFIDGRWVPPTTGARFDVIEPSTEELFLRVAEAAPEDMDRAVGAARAAFDEGPWPRLSHAERAGYLRAMAREIAARTNTISRIWSSEMGILAAAATAGVAGVPKIFEFYASLAEDFPFAEPHESSIPGQYGLLLREPVGVVGAIIPWNAPIILLAYKLAPALIAGCTVVLKASPEAPGALYVIAEIAEAIGLPPGVVNVVTADREVSELLVRDPRVDKISFTGSTAAGRRIASLCGERLARVTLELGGKSAAIISDDFSLDSAAESLAASAPRMTGQVCASLTRIIVSRHRHDEFVDALCAAMAGIRVGDPFDSEVQMGPLAMRRQRDRVEQLIATGHHDGATLATGGRRPPGLDRGFYIEPTVFADVDNSSTIATEEIFGPVLCVIPARDEQHAVELANQSPYGLNAAIFTDDAARALSFARRLRSGTVGQNGYRTDFGIAFGGFKQSGIGREGGREGLLPYLETKTVVLAADPFLAR